MRSLVGRVQLGEVSSDVLVGLGAAEALVGLALLGVVRSIRIALGRRQRQRRAAVTPSLFDDERQRVRLAVARLQILVAHGRLVICTHFSFSRSTLG